jgi:hypothetical protein
VRARQLARERRHPEQHLREPVAAAPYLDRERALPDRVEVLLQHELGPEAVQVTAADRARVRTLAHNELAPAAHDADAARALHALDPAGDQLGSVPDLQIEGPVDDDAHGRGVRRHARWSVPTSP